MFFFKLKNIFFCGSKNAFGVGGREKNLSSICTLHRKSGFYQSVPHSEIFDFDVITGFGVIFLGTEKRKTGENQRCKRGKYVPC